MYSLCSLLFSYSLWRFRPFCRFFPENVIPNIDLSERAVNVVVPTQVVELGEYNDSSEVVSSTATGGLLREVYTETNMETFSLDSVLNREYLVSTTPWTQAQAQNTVLTTTSFPEVLFTIPAVAAKLSGFKYFRGRIRFSIRVTSTSFVYGKLQVNFDPIANDDIRGGFLGNVYNGSCVPHILVSAGASEVAIFDVPYVSYHRATEIAGYSNGELGLFRTIVLHPLVDITGAASTASVIITAQFLDSEVFLPQSKEIVSKSKDGLASNALNSFSTIVGAVRNVPLSTAVSAVGKGLKFVGLSKPASVSMGTTVLANPFTSFPYGKGLAMSVKAAMDPENMVSVAPLVGGSDGDEMSFDHIFGTPCMVNSLVMNAASATAKLSTCSPYESNVDRQTYGDFVSKSFNYWSGSYKYKLYFTASKMQAAKFVVFISDSSVFTDWQGCYHSVVDVQGDTEFDFTVPYLRHNVVSATAATSNFAVWIKVLSWSQPDPALNTPISIAVYKACGSDFRVGSQLETELIVQSNPRADFKANFAPFHPSMTGYSTSGIVLGEEFRSLREVVHRDTPLITVTTGSTRVWNDTYVALDVKAGPEFWGAMYRFRRGTIRFKVVNKIANASVSCAFFTDGTKIVVGNISAHSANPVIDAEMPYYDSHIMRATFPNALNQQTRFLNWDTKNSRYLFKACGDDFSFHWLFPPLLQPALPDVLRGSSGYRTYCNT